MAEAGYELGSGIGSLMADCCKGWLYAFPITVIIIISLWKHPKWQDWAKRIALYALVSVVMVFVLIILDGLFNIII